MYPASLKSCPSYHLDPQLTLALKVIFHPGPKYFSPPLPGWNFSRGCNSSGNHSCSRGKPWVNICINMSISRSNSLTKHSLNSSMEQVETMFHSLNGWVKLNQFEIDKLQQRMVGLFTRFHLARVDCIPRCLRPITAYLILGEPLTQGEPLTYLGHVLNIPTAQHGKSQFKSGFH